MKGWNFMRPSFFTFCCGIALLRALEGGRIICHYVFHMNCHLVKGGHTFIFKIVRIYATGQ
jgi:hypothetical protein